MAFSSAPIFRSHPSSGTPWALSEVAGRFVEISGFGASAALTIAFTLVGEAQQKGEPVGWVTSMESSFYPPDAAQGGIDLSALVVIRLSGHQSIPRAAEKLLRSSAFGLVVLDLRRGDIPMPLQSRLTGLAHRHHTALICLSEKESAMFSIGSLVSLRGHAQRTRSSGNHFACTLRVLKDKRRGPTWSHDALYACPAGLC